MKYNEVNTLVFDVYMPKLQKLNNPGQYILEHEEITHAKIEGVSLIHMGLQFVFELNNDTLEQVFTRIRQFVNSFPTEVSIIGCKQIDNTGKKYVLSTTGLFLLYTQNPQELKERFIDGFKCKGYFL